MRPIEPAESGPKDTFLVSLQRCDDDPNFLARFYEHFLASSPAVRDKFALTDLDRQRRMLRRSLQLVAKATAGDPDGLRELNDRAETHSHSRLDIGPGLYALWLDSLIHCARTADPDWSSDVELAWRTILDVAIRHMIHRYPL